MRVASCCPAATEIVCGLGLAERLVAVSDACDYPPAITHLPRVTRAGSVADALAQAAAADILITNDSAAEHFGVETTIRLDPRSLTDVWSDVVRVGRALGLGMTAEAVANGFKSRVARVGSKLPPRVKSVRVLADSGLPWLADVVAAAGGALVDAADEPEVVISLTTTDSADFDPGESDAFAVRDASIFRRGGPRLVEAIETLAAILHPQVFPDLVARHAARYAKITRTDAVSGIS